jgi:autotransporter-associated beta strand protein
MKNRLPFPGKFATGLPTSGPFSSVRSFGVRSQILTGLCATGVLLVAGPAARATPGDWIGATGGLWGDGANWSLGVAPTAADDLTILGPANAAGDLEIDVAAAASANSLDFTNPSTSALTNTTSGADQTLTISAGAGAGISTGAGAVTIGSATANQNVNIALGASQTWDVGAGGLTATNAISDGGSAFGLTKTGTGTLTLLGANTFSGGLVVKAGVVSGDKAGGTTAAVFGGGSITLGDAVAGADAGLIVNGWANNYSNAIVVAAGAGARTLTSTWTNAGQIPILTGTISLNNTLTLNSTAASGMRLNGVISGTGGVVVNSTNTTANIRLGGANTFGGGVWVQQGRLELTNSSAAGTGGAITLGNASGSGDSTMVTNGGINVGNAITVASGNTGISTIGNVSGSGATFSGNVAVNHDLVLGTTGAGALTLSGVVSGGSPISISSTGAGSVNLSNSFNSFSGGITIKNGTLTQTGDTALGSGTVTLGDGASSDNATLAGNNGGANVSNSNAITIASGGTGIYTIADTGGRDFTLNGAIALNNAATFKTTSGGALFVNGVITGSSAVTIDGGSTTTKFVSFGADNSSTFTGNIAVQNKGTLKFGINNATGTQTVVTLDATSTIDAGGKSMTFAGLNGVTGSTVLNNGSGLTLGGGGAYSYGGALSNGGGSLTLSGAGTQTITGSITGTGAVNANAGTLVYDGAAISMTGSTNVASGATLRIANTVSQGTGANAGRIFVNSGATLTGTGTIAFSDTNAGSTGLSVTGVTKPGGTGTIGTLTFDGTNSVRAVAAFETGATFTFDLGAGLTSDLIALTGGQASDIFFQGSNVLNFNDLTGGSLSVGDYTLFSSDVSGAFANVGNLSVGTGLDGYAATLQQSGNNLVLNIAAVPEPGTLALIGCGLGFLTLCRRRQRKSPVL